MFGRKNNEESGLEKLKRMFYERFGKWGRYERAAQRALTEQYEKDPTGQMVTPDSDSSGFGFAFRNEPYEVQERLDRNLQNYDRAAFQANIGSPSAPDTLRKAEHDYVRDRNFVKNHMGPADRAVREDLGKARQRLGMGPVDLTKVNAEELARNWGQNMRKESPEEYTARRTEEIQSRVPAGQTSIIQQVCQERANKEIAALPQQYKMNKDVRTVPEAA